MRGSVTRLKRNQRPVPSVFDLAIAVRGSRCSRVANIAVLCRIYRLQLRRVLKAIKFKVTVISAASANVQSWRSASANCKGN